MFANNEIGTINPIAEIGAIAKENGILFHTDAVQAVGHTEIDVKAMNIDLLSMSAHKFYGPKGVGALYIKKGIKITPLIHGGGQERSRRAGTENIIGIIGMGTAIELAINELKSEEERLTKLRDKFIDGILEKVPYSWLNGPRENRIAGNCNISFEFIEGESVLLLLDMNNICASSGSACTSGSLDPSHVLLAIGLPHEKAHGSLRVSLGLFNTEEDVEYLLEKFTDAVQAVGHTEIDVKAMNIDLLSMSAHKFYGPKGVGALYIKKGIKITPLIHGGGQERSRRAGTENIIGIIGMGTAIELAINELKSEEERLTKLRDKFIDGILEKVPYSWLNGPRENRIAGNCNISFEFIEGESVLLLLDMNNICASSGSACTSGSLDPSHVLLAIGLPHEKAHGSLRVSLGLFNTEEDVEYLLEKLPPIVARMREMSPLYEEFIASQKADK